MKISVRTLTVFVFFLFLLDFLGYGWYLLGLCLLIAFYYAAKAKVSFKMDILLVSVILLSITDYITILFNGATSADIVTLTFKYLVMPIGGLCVGIILSKTAKDCRSLAGLYLLAILPMACHGFLNMTQFSGVQDYSRSVRDFWTNIPWKATLQATLVSMTIPLLLSGVVWPIVKNRSVGIVLSILAILSAAIAAMIASRTFFVIVLVVIAVQVLVYCKLTGNRKSLRFLIGGVVVGAVVAMVAALNWEKLSEIAVIQRFMRMDATEDLRIKLFKNILDNFLDYPFGNMPYFYSHNTWLDFLRVVGWIPFVLFGVITVIQLQQMLRIMAMHLLPKEQKIFVFGVHIVLLLTMFVEPIVDGSPMMFFCLFYFMGCNSGIMSLERRLLCQDSPQI